MKFRRSCYRNIFKSNSFTNEQLTEREKSNIDTLIAEVQQTLEKTQNKQAKYYNLRRKEFHVNIVYKIFGETHVLSST